jgi:prepilin-type N-terminal cleavage/methylation domain-containing protein
MVMGRGKHACDNRVHNEIYAEELTHAHEEEGASAPSFELFYCMKKNGFTLIEMLVTVIVVCVIIIIALPMHAVRVKKLELVHAKAQLMTIKESEDRFKMENGTYTADVTKLVNWKNSAKRYRFQVEHADTTRFTAQASGDMDNDRVYDDNIWAIDQSGTLTKVK